MNPILETVLWSAMLAGTTIAVLTLCRALVRAGTDRHRRWLAELAAEAAAERLARRTAARHHDTLARVLPENRGRWGRNMPNI
ncbi:MAG: hypothetical protein WC718_00400 [Phycisphaerales bacterium]|jgi:hypothetical protein